MVFVDLKGWQTRFSGLLLGFVFQFYMFLTVYLCFVFLRTVNVEEIIFVLLAGRGFL